VSVVRVTFNLCFPIISEHLPLYNNNNDNNNNNNNMNVPVKEKKALLARIGS
jgi:hypothetical protein